MNPPINATEVDFMKATLVKDDYSIDAHCRLLLFVQSRNASHTITRTNEY